MTFKRKRILIAKNHLNFVRESFHKLFLIAPCLVVFSCGIQTNTKNSNRETTQTISVQNQYSLSRLENCGINITPDKTSFSLFVNYQKNFIPLDLTELNFSGWNHTANGSTSEWLRLTQPFDAYTFKTVTVPDQSCNNVPTLKMVLVKKISDWNHQHANGFENKFNSVSLRFGNLSTLVMDIKIKQKNTHIPSSDLLKKVYSNWIRPDEIDALDRGHANIGITLYGEENIKASVIVEIDRALTNQWIRVTIPIPKMTLYEEINYQRRSLRFEDIANRSARGMQVVAETKSGSVLRAKISNWNEAIPESFKELDITVKNIAFQIFP